MEQSQQRFSEGRTQEPKRKIFPKRGACLPVMSIAGKSRKMRADKRRSDLPTWSLMCFTRSNYRIQEELFRCYLYCYHFLNFQEIYHFHITLQCFSDEILKPMNIFAKSIYIIFKSTHFKILRLSKVCMCYIIVCHFSKVPKNQCYQTHLVAILMTSPYFNFLVSIIYKNRILDSKDYK